MRQYCVVVSDLAPEDVGSAAGCDLIGRYSSAEEALFIAQTVRSIHEDDQTWATAFGPSGILVSHPPFERED